METEGKIADHQAIVAIIERQFGSLSWTPEDSADWDMFMSDFFPGAPLYPSIRPVKQQSVNAFIERLHELKDGKLRSFHEKVLGTEVRVFGNIAVALAGCETVENETDVSRGVEMLLLVKDAGQWRIASQAWDMESDQVKVPPYLRGAEGT